MVKNSYTHQDIKILKREVLYKGFVHLEKVELTFRLFNGDQYSSVINREVVLKKQAAGVLVYNDEQQRFLLIEQFRVGAADYLPQSPWHLEIIAGLLDGDESPEECLYRESIEEAGCELRQLQHLFTFFPSAGGSNEIFHLYTGQAELPEDGSIFGLEDEGENIKVHLFNYQELDALFSQHQLLNAPVIIALQWLKQHIQELYAK